MLAIRTIEQMLTYYVEDGGKLFWPESTSEMEVSDVIPRFRGQGT